jgi:hypothetical protein
MQATNEGIIPMKTHRCMPPVAQQPRAVPAEVTDGATRSNPQSPAARTILALVFALGSFGAAAAASGYGIAGHAGADAGAASMRLAASADSASTSHATPISNAWIY